MKKNCTLFLSCLILFFYICGCNEDEPKTVQYEQNIPSFNEKDESAQAGGIGFKGIGWKNNQNAQIFANTNAIKGGTIKASIRDFPATLRFSGKDSNFVTNITIKIAIYESLLKLHPNTLDFLPSLATHWQILQDYKTFRFRINPKACWADGHPVTSKDIVATWEFMVDKGLESPYFRQIFMQFNKPVAESKYMVHITAKKLNWNLFRNFALMAIYPAHVIKNLTGKEYLTKYQKKAIVGTGPYEMPESLIEQGKKIVLLRRKDYWGEEEKFNKGLYNFDRIEFIVEKDSHKAFERFKNKEFDVYNVDIGVAQKWDMNDPKIGRGLIQERKIFNKAPQLMTTLIFNMRKAPFNNLDVRKAFTLLFNREKIIKTHFSEEYAPLDSYYSNSIYANPKNARYRYDFAEAVKLLVKAGWDQKNKDGWLVKNGNIFETSISGLPKYLEFLEKIYGEDLRKAGIKINFDRLDNYEKILKHEFDMCFIGLQPDQFPDVDQMWPSDLADQQYSYNFAGLKLQKVDQICKIYNRMFLQRQRVEAVHILDAILMKHHPFALGWGMNCQYIFYWNEFDYPIGYISNTGDFWDILKLWSISKEKQDKLQKAMQNKKIKLKQGIVNQKYWMTKK